MKKNSKFLSIILTLVLLITLNTTAFGSEVNQMSDSQAYELYEQMLDTLNDYTSYRYKLVMESDMAVIGIGSSEIEHEYESMITEGTVNDKGHFSSSTTSKSGDENVITETLVQDGNLYTRTYKNGEEACLWDIIGTDTQNTPLDLTMKEMQELNGLWDNIYMDASWSYSFGESRIIDGSEYVQIISVLDNSEIKDMLIASLTEELMNDADQSTELGQTIYAYMADEISRNMITDIKISYLAKSDSKQLHSMTWQFLFQVDLLGMEISANVNAECTLYDINQPIELPDIDFTSDKTTF